MLFKYIKNIKYFYTCIQRIFLNEKFSNDSFDEEFIYIRYCDSILRII